MSCFMVEPKVTTEFWKTGSTGQFACMHDTELFTGEIFSYPVNRQGKTFDVKGIFCSLPCAKAYMLERDDPQRSSLFTQMCTEVYGLNEAVRPAPPSCILTKYWPEAGGGIDIKTFRDLLGGKVVVQEVDRGIVPFQYETTQLCISRLCQQLNENQDDPVSEAKGIQPAIYSSNPLSVRTLDKFIRP